MTGPGTPAGKPRTLLKPPFCRESELADIVSAIRSEGCRAVFVTSENGFGASTILRELAAVAREHVPVLSLRGSHSLAKVPFGVMAPYFSTVDGGSASIRMAVLRAVLAELRRRQEGLAPAAQARPEAGPDAAPASQGPAPASQDLPLILVDDAHAMDPATAELIVSLVRSGTVNLVATHWSHHRLPDPLPKLWTAGMAENIVLGPLDQEQAHAFCEAMLGGRVLRATGWHFWSLSGGNPLFLRLLVTQAVELGSLARRSGSWSVDPNAPIHSPDLEEAVRRELRGISKTASEALNLIALSEPVEDAAIEELVGPAAVRELLDWHLVQYGAPPSRLLGLANPIYGEAVRDMVPMTQSRRLHEQLIGRLDDDPVNTEAMLRRVVWALEIGIEVPDDRLLAAAVLASKIHQSTTALELANQIRGRDHRLRATVVRARAHYNMGDYQGALALMESTVQESRNHQELLFGSLLRASTRSALGMPVDALAGDAAVLRSKGEELAQANPAEAEAIRGLSESGALLIELMMLSRQGHYSAMEAPMAGVVESEGMSESAIRLNRAMVLTMDSERLTAQGFPEQGMARAAEAYAIEHEEDNDVFFLPETILLRHLAAAMCCGDWQGAAKVLEEFSLEDGPVVFSFGGGANVVRGMAFLRGGKVADGLDLLLAGVDALRLSDPQQLLGLCTAMAAYAAARLGRWELAEQLAGAYVEGTGMFVVLSHERAYLAAARYLLRHDAGTPVGLVALADAALAEGSTTLELNALALALELGDESVVPRLERVASGVEGQWARALCGYASALGAGDGQLLAAAGEALAAAGLFGFAERALALSVPLLAGAGNQEDLRRAREGLRKVAERLGMPESGRVRGTTPKTPAATAGHTAAGHAAAATARHTAGQTAVKPAGHAGGPESTRLTRREREVATLAVDGRTDREIAAQLNLSIRTVEGHLYRVYAKLGVGGREDLPGIPLE
ncbi:LuxR C-terminal-related transcriptional regulator [Arthrobacter sp. SDTb3-6]|uniref:helix-turn-helix transcriptional regulator n=1 Tax=Arthrobacter sp. SDTb3-6 TaxID=2713571 RepID=UPI00352637BE